MTKTKQVAKPEQTSADIFMAKVITEFTTGDSPVALTQFQRRLAKNYFITLDAVLAKAEAGRLKKSEKWRDEVPVTWDHVNMQKLAQDVVAVCRIGLDPAQKNHIAMIPYKNNTTKLYDIGFIEEYRGIELKSMKYGLDVPDAVIVHLKYSNDIFTPYFKDKDNKSDTYEFKVVNAFDRGKVEGGFYYHFYAENFAKNKLVVMTLEEIEKRKPRYASPEFWGGEKPVWKDGKKTGKMESVDGWRKEMQWKTVYRAAYNNITIDSQKIDADYMRMKEIEGSVAEHNIQAEIDAKANKEFIDIGSGEVIDAEVTTEMPQPAAEKPGSEKTTDAPAEGKEATDARENPIPAKEFGAESPIDAALRTGKAEKEQKQAEPKANPKWVAELNKWLDSVQPEMRFACMEKIKKDCFPELCEEDQDKVKIHYDELQEASQGDPAAAEHPGREF